MKSKREKRQALQENRRIKKMKGTGWCKKDDVFCSEILESQEFSAALSGLKSEIEKLEALILLVKSSQNSIDRTKSISKPTYFRKPHEFKDRYAMAKALIAERGFIKEWTSQYQFFKERNMRLDYRPTIGRKDHDMGYTKDNIEAVPFSQNASERAVERFSTPCIAVVATKADSTATVFECSSVVNSIARIDEVMQLGVTRNMMHGNLTSGIRRVTEDYSIYVIGRDRLMNAPMIVGMGIPISVVTDDTSVRYVQIPDVQEEAKSCLELYVDDFGVVYIEFDESIENMKEEVAI
ncbi:hypothetical protein [Paenibacillus sp. FSL R7-0333]|uniref:hypothetical protein n=1 Tax=Paenibacillus sp. FSL R7-0333 TaxID=1926587 RepID=UPI00096FC5D7|nr:hypothetical protein BK146_32320 [Paenibacillus sp. FSL R7-0333]